MTRTSLLSIAPVALFSLVALTGCPEDKPAVADAGKAPVTSAPAKPSAPPAVTPSAAPAPKPSASAAAAPAKKKEMPKEAVKHPVPADWIELSEPKRGFGFSVPKGTKGESVDKNGMAIYVATLPDPFKDSGVFVMAYKDPKKTMDDLFKDAGKVMEAMGQKNFKLVGDKKDFDKKYAVSAATWEDDKGKKEKGKVLVALDVTDRYVLIVGGPEGDFAKNEQTYDALWESFDMYSDQ